MFPCKNIELVRKFGLVCKFLLRLSYGVYCLCGCLCSFCFSWKALDPQFLLGLSHNCLDVGQLSECLPSQDASDIWVCQSKHLSMQRNVTE